jgi:site-specific DNA-methyltransferase (adenine-specific)
MTRAAGNSRRPAVRSRRPSPASLSSQLHTSLRTRRASLTFYLGDCVRVMTQMAALGHQPVSVMVTSPPYNLGVDYRTYDDQLPREEYLQWTNRWIAAAASLLATDGSLFLNVGHKPTDPWVAMDVAQTGRRHLHLQNLIHWVKSIAIDDRGLALGHYKPINSDRFVNDCHEFVFHFTPSGRTRLDRRAIGVPYQDKSNVARWQSAGVDLRCRGNAWFIPYETIQSRDKDRPHPATFPPKMPEMCVKLHGLSRTRLVMDPFVGLGSTAVACAGLGVSFVGIDMDEQYLDEAVARTIQAFKDAGEVCSVERMKDKDER